MEESRIRIVGAPREFLDRPEFGPRLPEAGGTVWAPLHPSFAPRILLAPDEGFGAESAGAAARAGASAEGEAAGDGDRHAAAIAVAERPVSPIAGSPLVEPPRGRALAELFRSVFDRHRIEPSARALENLNLIEEGSARLVLTGQQPGFLTGPLYTVYKAASAAAAAAHLGEVTGIRHVPVFWIASEDHDLDEARGAGLPGPGDSTVQFSVPYPSERRPLGSIPFDRAAAAVLDAALRHLEGHVRSAEARTLGELYRGRDFTGGFAAVVAALFAPYGLLLIEPDVLRPLAAPIFRRAVEDAAGLLGRIAEGIAEVERRNLKAQVPARFPLFLIEGGRRHHLEPSGEGRFVLEGVGRSLGVPDLLRALDSHPETFSAGVLLRPAVQNAILPNAAYVGGPAELAYFAQLGPLFDWLGLPAPGIGLRLGATLIEVKAARALRHLGLWPLRKGAGERWRAARKPEDLIPSSGTGAESEFRAHAAETRTRLERALAALPISEEMRRGLLTSAGKVAVEIERLGARAERAARQAAEEDIAAARRVLSTFFPEGTLQERKWNVLHFIARHGRGWIDDLVRAVEKDPFLPGHRWVFFDASQEG
jgi:bacillithiol biosynthesis cysteine-adding enzyme BshC